MSKKKTTIVTMVALFIGIATLAEGCGAGAPAATPRPGPAVSATATVTPSPVPPVPQITGVALSLTQVPRYQMLEMQVAIQADYSNPYDLRQVSLDGVFGAPDGTRMAVPGFWDGKDTWRVRFTPSQTGTWNYELTVKDAGGISQPAKGTFDVTASDLHGWLQPGKSIDPALSGHYLVYQDGTPFYGIGHADATTLFSGGFSLDSGFSLLSQMKAAGENYVVWWPLYTNSPINNSYADYSSPNMSIIDLVVKDAEKKGIFLVFTIWDHPELRDSTHAWGPGRWPANGFSKLGDIKSFFTSDEAWAWQENFYRYIIARWGYSTSIGMWQTVSEINGTNAYDQTNPWHDKVNAYFLANDPYHHPTTASMSGDTDWPEGHAVMAAPQVHVYDFKYGDLAIDPVHAAQVIADWTTRMWARAEKPNWVGEYGVPGNAYYPEMFHNANWAALASGAALTPAEWNDGSSWGEMTHDMDADLGRLGRFVADLPLAKINPLPLKIASSDPQVRAWGLAGNDAGLIWAQDFSLEGKSMAEIRADKSIRKGVTLLVQDLPAGNYLVHPYDTWQGKYLTTFQLTCAGSEPCKISLLGFHADLALRLERK